VIEPAHIVITQQDLRHSSTFWEELHESAFHLLEGRGGAISPAARADKPAPTAANLDTQAWVRHFPGAEPVITKANAAVAAKLENPA
jgi:hypothetical protein